RARQFRDEHTHRVSTYDEFKQTMEGLPGFVIAPWCGMAECEAAIKTETQATIRNMPNDTNPGGKCIRCDMAATPEAGWGRGSGGAGGRGGPGGGGGAGGGECRAFACPTRLTCPTR